MHKRTYKYRIYPTKAQTRTFTWMLARCRELYNAALMEWREAYKLCGKSINFAAQSGQLPQIKKVRPEYKDIYSQTLQNVLHRLDNTRQAFYQRCKEGSTPGYPRCKGSSRYNSFTYPQSGWNLQNGRLTLSKISGSIRVRLHREIIGKVKTVTIKREGEEWYVLFSVETEIAPLPESSTIVGVDLGITVLAALSTGEMVVNPRFFRLSADKLKRGQQQLAKHQRGSNRRAETKRQVVNLHRHTANQRRDFAHKLSRRLVDSFGTIVFEDLQIKSMTRRAKPKAGDPSNGEAEYLANGAAAKSGLNREMLSASWGMLQQMCVVKAESAGRHVLFVPPQNTSRRCSACGYTDANNRKTQADFFCQSCGTGMNADLNAAINIQRLGSNQRNQLWLEAQMPRRLRLGYFTEEFQEKSDLNGQTYRVQYFERAVFELHTENQPPNDVLLAQLGTFRYKAKYQGGPPPPPVAATPTAVATNHYTAIARVDKATPHHNQTVTVLGTLKNANGAGVAGVAMHTIWHYKSTNSGCNGGPTDANGNATCSRDISTATYGYQVNIDVTFILPNGQTVQTSTSFTPHAP